MSSNHCACEAPEDVFNNVCGKCLMPLASRTGGRKWTLEADSIDGPNIGEFEVVEVVEASAYSKALRALADSCRCHETGPRCPACQALFELLR